MTLADSISEHKHAATRLGMMMDYAWDDDPKRLVFTAARYKFVAKMLAGRGDTLEVGCGDAFFSRIVAQHVVTLTVTDCDLIFVDDVNSRANGKWPFSCMWHDMTMAPMGIKRFDAVYALDVLEHIQPAAERAFIGNINSTLRDHGVAIIGTPSLESQRIASRLSREEHVNCKTGEELRALLLDYFHSVFMFGMADEVVHTGHLEMAHYLFAVCADPRTCSQYSTIGR